MTDELNPEVIDVEKIVDNAGESSEETEQKTSETSEAEKVDSQPEQTPDAETIELIKSIREEVGEKRFNGLMSNWQKDRGELLKYQEKEKVSSQQAQPGQDDALIDYFYKKIEERRTKEESAMQMLVKQEVDEVRSIYPHFSEKQLLETANELSIPGKPASIMTAAIHLSKVDEAIKTKGQLTADEILKKNKAATIAGRSGVQNSSGTPKYDPEKDKNKSVSELIDEAFKE